MKPYTFYVGENEHVLVIKDKNKSETPHKTYIIDIDGKTKEVKEKYYEVQGYYAEYVTKIDGHSIGISIREKAHRSGAYVNISVDGINTEGYGSFIPIAVNKKWLCVYVLLAIGFSTIIPLPVTSPSMFGISSTLNSFSQSIFGLWLLSGFKAFLPVMSMDCKITNKAFILCLVVLILPVALDIIRNIL